MRICNEAELKKFSKLLEDNSDELNIIKSALESSAIINNIDKNKALIYDRIISELLDEQLDDDIIVGIAFMLGIIQGQRMANKNSDQRTTANRSI